MFWQNEEFSMGLGRDIHLDGVVCVVDAVFGRQVRSQLRSLISQNTKQITQQMEEDHAADGIGESLRCVPNTAGPSP